MSASCRRCSIRDYRQTGERKVHTTIEKQMFKSFDKKRALPIMHYKNYNLNN